MIPKRLTSILGNSQRLDGGAMFGNVPKALWSQWILADQNNTIPLQCRTLLIQEPHRLILLETGIGAFFNPTLKARYGVVEPQHVLLDNLQKLGFQHTDIDVVVLSHLHFDHAGGLLSIWNEGVPSQLLFPKATFIVGQEAWSRSQNPHYRDRASFIPELNQLLMDSGRCEIIEGTQSKTLGSDYRFHYSFGHTPGMLLTEIAMPRGPIVFMADLIPGTHWVHLPITMGYDRAPELLIDEKQRLLQDLVNQGGRLFYTHDAKIALSSVAQDKSGRFIPTECLEEIRGLET